MCDLNIFFHANLFVLFYSLSFSRFFFFFVIIPSVIYFLRDAIICIAIIHTGLGELQKLNNIFLLILRRDLSHIYRDCTSQLKKKKNGTRCNLSSRIIIRIIIVNGPRDTQSSKLRKRRVKIKKSRGRECILEQHVRQMGRPMRKVRVARVHARCVFTRVIHIHVRSLARESGIKWVAKIESHLLYRPSCSTSFTSSSRADRHSAFRSLFSVCSVLSSGRVEQGVAGD